MVIVRTMLAMGLLAIPLLVMSHCGAKGKSPRPIDSVKAPEFIGDAFAIETANDGVNEKAIAIRSGALDKEFLLQSGASLMPWVGSSQSNRSRIVAFRKKADFLYMMEAVQGHIVTDDIDQELILARFPIVSSEGDRYTIDFNTGMNRLFFASDWRASDFEGVDVDRQTDAVKVRLSYIKSAHIDAVRQQLVITQVAQMDAANGDGTRDLGTVEMKYYLQPYAPTEGFTPTETTDFTQRGYFEVSPQYVEGVTKVYASKFANKPLQFAISANTPEEYRQAVIDGILYWNKTFGEERLTAVIAPEGVTAPDFNFNVVQWINWDTAGFAYADAQADPRTGEILHAQVYMTSVFAASGRRRAEAILKQLEEDNGAGPSAYIVGIKGFDRGYLCLRNLTSQYKKALEGLLKDGADDDRILKASQDYVREVIAHEVGHTLGLRHNFAGSLHANFKPADLMNHVRSYFENGRSPEGIHASSSVMEYQLFEESILTGDTMTRGDDPALDYDRQAIQFLYAGTSPEPGTEPLFCTDTSNGVFLDCQVFDRGRTPFEYYDSQLVNLQTFLAKTVDVDGVAVPQIYLQPTDAAVSTILAPYLLIADALSPYGKVLSLRRAEASVIEDVVRAKELDFLLADAESFQGLNRFLTLPQLPDAPSEDYEPARAALERALVKGWLDRIALFSAPGARLADHGLGDAAGSQLTATLKQILAATTGATETIEWNRENEPTRIVNLPAYRYSAQVRLNAATILKSELSDNMTLGYLAIEQAKSGIVGQLNEAVGENIALEDLYDAPEAISRFVIEQRKVLAALN